MTEQDEINQAITATKRVMRALQRQCLPDLVTAWQELLELSNVHPPADFSKSRMQKPATWLLTSEMVWIALESIGAELWWFNAHSMIQDLYVQEYWRSQPSDEVAQ